LDELLALYGPAIESDGNALSVAHVLRCLDVVTRVAESLPVCVRILPTLEQRLDMVDLRGQARPALSIAEHT
jgi:hypothetical protein